MGHTKIGFRIEEVETWEGNLVDTMIRRRKLHIFIFGFDKKLMHARHADGMNALWR